MSGSVSLTGADVNIINDRILNDLGDGDVAVLSHPNEIATLKTGKNGNSIYALNQSGLQCDLEMRVIRASADDKFLNGLMKQQLADLASFVLMSGEFVKKVGDGLGNVTSDTYILSGGIFVKKVDAKSNTEGDTEQSLSIYMMRFANAPRAIT
jgi:hypothetical protein